MRKLLETFILDTLIFFQNSEHFFLNFEKAKQTKQRPKMNNMKIIKFFMLGHFHSIKSLFDVCKFLV